MQNVLIAAYYFPPYALVSAVRAAKFCKYLPQFGWEPWVVTVDSAYYQGKVINELPPEINRMNVFRFPFRRFPGCVTLVKLLFPLIISFIAFRHRKKIDAVLMTGSPFHPFLISGFLKGLLGMPTFLDFRDAWSLNNGFDGRQAENYWEKFRQRFLVLLERIAIHFASGVIFATQTLQDEYRALILTNEKKYYTVTNGYDTEDFNSVTPIRTVDSRSIILTGQFNLYTPEVLAGLMNVLKFFPFLHFIYIGNEHDIIARTAKSSGSENQVTTLPYLPHRELISRIAGADYGLVTSGMPNILGTKIFDYLALKKPVLCFVPKGSEITRNFAEEKSVVICEAPHTLESIKNGLSSLFNLKERTNDTMINKFTRKETTKKLSQILQMACPESQPCCKVRQILQGSEVDAE